VAASSVDVILTMFRRFEDGQLEAALELLADDFVAVVPPSMSAEPDVYEGHEGARRYMAGFEGLMEDVHYELRDLTVEGDAVLGSLRLVGRGVSSGLEVAQSGAIVFWVVDGKVKRIEPHPDMEAARGALESRAQSGW
jgi:ketosteroid isomerase-like protein